MLTLLGLEVKGLGEHGVANCTPSIHKNGQPWEITGTTNPPITLTADQAKEYIEHIDQICKKYNLEYLEKHYRNQLDSNGKIYQGERHTSLISIANNGIQREESQTADGEDAAPLTEADIAKLNEYFKKPDYLKEILWCLHLTS